MGKSTQAVTLHAKTAIRARTITTLSRAGLEEDITTVNVNAVDNFHLSKFIAD